MSLDMTEVEGTWPAAPEIDDVELKSAMTWRPTTGKFKTLFVCNKSLSHGRFVDYHTTIYAQRLEGLGLNDISARTGDLAP